MLHEICPNFIFGRKYTSTGCSFFLEHLVYTFILALISYGNEPLQGVAFNFLTLFLEVNVSLQGVAKTEFF